MTLPDYDPGPSPEQDTGTCSSCGQPATFIDDRPGANPVGYCSTDLPAGLQGLASAGQLTSAEGVAGDAGQVSQDQATQDEIATAAARVEKAAARAKTRTTG